MYVIFDTQEQAQTALDADNSAMGYPNETGTQNAWQYFLNNGKYIVMATGLPDGALAGFERVTYQVEGGI